MSPPSSPRSFSSRLTVPSLRALVASRLTQHQLDFYNLLEAANPEETWLNFLRDKPPPPASRTRQPKPTPASLLNRPPVTSLASLRSYALRLGSEHGWDEVLWADSFAFEVLAEELRLAVLFVDMEREGGSSPYRLLSSSKEQSEAGNNSPALFAPR